MHGRAGRRQEQPALVELGDVREKGRRGLALATGGRDQCESECVIAQVLEREAMYANDSAGAGRRGSSHGDFGSSRIATDGRSKARNAFMQNFDRRARERARVTLTSACLNRA